MALDTAMAACSVAVHDTASGKTLASAFAAMERGHAEAVAPMVEQVMREAGQAFSALQRIAVTTGPGTFTGVRIGLAMARGLGLALNIPVIGIDTLTAIAANENSARPLFVAADARNGELYAAGFDTQRNVLLRPCVSTPADLAGQIPQGALLLGTGAPALLAASGRKDIGLSSASCLPLAANFAHLAATAATPDAMPSPLYLRIPDARPQLARLRPATSLRFQAAGSTSCELLGAMHAEAFDTAWSAQEFASLLAMPGAAALIVLEQDEPAGFVLTRRAMDEVEIITVCTRPFAQRRGVATALLDHQFTELLNQGAARVFIEVAASNRAARALYAKLGFAPAGVRKGYYSQAGGGRDDAIVMRRDLTP